jgi:hypothetical protein
MVTDNANVTVKMKVTLEFDTSDPDQQVELNQCMGAQDMAAFIFELLNNFHRKYKYVEESPHVDDVIEAIHDLAREYNVEKFRD